MSIYFIYSLTGIFGIVFIAQLYFYLRYMTGALRAIRKAKKEQLAIADKKTETDTSQFEKGCSVIICARNEKFNLEH